MGQGKMVEIDNITIELAGMCDARAFSNHGHSNGITKTYYAAVGKACGDNVCLGTFGRVILYDDNLSMVTN